MKNRFSDVLRNGGVSNAEYESVKPEIRSSNINMLRFSSALAMVAMTLMAAYALVVDNPAYPPLLFIVFALINAVILFFAAKVFTDKNDWSFAGVYSFTTGLYLFAGIQEIVFDSGNISVAFIAFILIIPTIFISRPWRMAGSIVVACAIFCVLVAIFEQGIVASSDYVDAALFGTVAVLLSFFAISFKVRGLVSSRKLRELGVTDILTSLGNRFSLEHCVQELEQSGDVEDVIVVVLDVNGLKTVNDRLSHGVGDELLRGAAKALLKSFPKDAKCFRLGGDEFAVIMRGNENRVRHCLAQFQRNCEAWKSEYPVSLSAAAGYALVCEYPGSIMENAFRAADISMYANKARYYTEESRDRRMR